MPLSLMVSQLVNPFFKAKVRDLDREAQELSGQFPFWVVAAWFWTCVYSDHRVCTVASEITLDSMGSDADCSSFGIAGPDDEQVWDLHGGGIADACLQPVIGVVQSHPGAN